MPVNQNNYGSRGGNIAIVLLLPDIVADDRLVYFDHNKKSGHWVIRDFISGQRLDNFNGDSQLTVSDIEAGAKYDEFPIWCNVEEQPEKWRAYLELRTTAVRHLNGPLDSTNAPNPRAGNWQPIRF